MGNPAYEVTGGSITLDNEDLLTMSPEERSLAGNISLISECDGNKRYQSEWIPQNHLQSPPPAHRTRNESSLPYAVFQVREASAHAAVISLKHFSNETSMSDSHGGEKRKFEVLQLKLLKPTYIILDEIDSGLDLDAFKLVAKMLSECSGPDTSIIIITHYFEILESFTVDQVVVMDHGVITRRGWAELASEIRQKGFKE
jgi:Fe-S cluster assembly ATP-binding protein